MPELTASFEDGQDTRQAGRMLALVLSRQAAAAAPSSEHAGKMRVDRRDSSLMRSAARRSRGRGVVVAASP